MTTAYAFLGAHLMRGRRLPAGWIDRAQCRAAVVLWPIVRDMPLNWFELAPHAVRTDQPVDGIPVDVRAFERHGAFGIEGRPGSWIFGTTEAEGHACIVFYDATSSAVLAAWTVGYIYHGVTVEAKREETETGWCEIVRIQE